MGRLSTTECTYLATYSCSPVCLLGALCCMCGVLGHLAPVRRCTRSVRCVACVVSWATWLLFTGVHTRCVVLCVRCPRPRSVEFCGHLWKIAYAGRRHEKCRPLSVRQIRIMFMSPCCGLNWELSCFWKIPKYDKPDSAQDL